MKGIVIEKGEEYFTYLKKIFLSIDNIQLNYNWLITAYECYPQNKKYATILSEEYCWMTGEEITEMVYCEDFQWIWGVFSVFPKDITKEEVLQYKLPKADGYGRIWQNPIVIQHPFAEIEIMAWDSTMTIFVSRDDCIADLLRENNVFAKDLEKYNEFWK